MARGMSIVSGVFLLAVLAALLCPAPVSAIDLQQVYYEPELELYLHYAGTAYCDTPYIMNWTCNFCVDQTEAFTPVATFWNETSQIFAYLGVATKLTPPKIVLSFRGTDATDLENWIENLSASHTIPYPHLQNASVHSGFYGAYRSLQDQIFPVLREQLQLYPGAELALTGHSLGGALATVALPQIYFELNVPLPKNISLYTFGSPRVGDEGWADLCNSLVDQTFRVTHYRDIVPHLPPREIGFLHVAQEIWYSAENTSTYIVCNMTGEDPNCADSLWFAISVYDHLHYLMGQPIAGCEDVSAPRAPLAKVPHAPRELAVPSVLKHAKRSPKNRFGQ